MYHRAHGMRCVFGFDITTAETHGLPHNNIDMGLGISYGWPCRACGTNLVLDVSGPVIVPESARSQIGNAISWRVKKSQKRFYLRKMPSASHDTQGLALSPPTQPNKRRGTR